MQKFASEAERVLAVILERDAQKWFKPAKGQFHIFYKQGADHPEYQPDFVAGTKVAIYMLEPKASSQMEDVIVQAKKEAAIRWCKNASDCVLANGGKPWRYLLIPHNAIAVNMTLDGLAESNSAQKAMKLPSALAPLPSVPFRCRSRFTPSRFMASHETATPSSARRSQAAGAWVA